MVPVLVLLAAVGTLRGDVRLEGHGHRVAVRAEIAQTPKARARGLSGRRSLAPNAGMLFVNPRPVRDAFWMYRTRIPLSVAFADGRGRIEQILDMAPCARLPCPLHRPRRTYRYALEVNRGAYRRWGIRPGDRLVPPS
jgi:uncharacterized membrane protein (UPF0127 family)